MTHNTHTVQGLGARMLAEQCEIWRLEFKDDTQYPYSTGVRG